MRGVVLSSVNRRRVTKVCGPSDAPLLGRYILCDDVSRHVTNRRHLLIIITHVVRFSLKGSRHTQRRHQCIGYPMCLDTYIFCGGGDLEVGRRTSDLIIRSSDCKSVVEPVKCPAR